MLNFDKQLYIVDCKYFKTPHLCSHGEVQELIKRNYSDIVSIYKADIIAGEQVDFKHFIMQKSISNRPRIKSAHKVVNRN